MAATVVRAVEVYPKDAYAAMSKKCISQDLSWSQVSLSLSILSLFLFCLFFLSLSPLSLTHSNTQTLPLSLLAHSQMISPPSRLQPAKKWEAMIEEMNSTSEDATSKKESVTTPVVKV